MRWCGYTMRHAKASLAIKLSRGMVMHEPLSKDTTGSLSRFLLRMSHISYSLPYLTCRCPGITGLQRRSLRSTYHVRLRLTPFLRSPAFEGAIEDEAQ